MAGIDKLVEALLGPVGIVWALNCLACALFLKRRNWFPASIAGTSALLLFLFGSTDLSAWLLATLEKPYSGKTAKDVPFCDAIIVLGGMMGRSSNDVLGFNLSPETDRAVTGYELLRQGKASFLVFGGGNRSQQWSESQHLTNWFGNWSGSSSNMIALPIAGTTRDEALYVQSLAKDHKWRKIILITSAYHLRRAEALFKHLGLETVPVGADFAGISALEQGEPFNPVPRPSQLMLLKYYLHEKIGSVTYWWRGWID